MEDEPEEEEFRDYIELKEITGGRTNLAFEGGAKEIKIKGGSHILKICKHVETLDVFGGCREINIKAPVDNLIIKGGVSKIYIHNYKDTKVNKLDIIGGTHEIWIYTQVDEILIRGGITKVWGNFKNAKINKIETVGGQRDLYLNPLTEKAETKNEGGTCNIHKTDYVPEPEFYQESLSDNKIAITKLKDQKFEEPCTICLNDFKPGNDVYFLPCFHCYHVTCLREWVKKNKTCPICKYVLRNKLD